MEFYVLHAQPRQSKAYGLAFCFLQKAMTSQPAFPLSQKSLAKQNFFGSPIIKRTTTRLFFFYLFAKVGFEFCDFRYL